MKITDPQLVYSNRNFSKHIDDLQKAEKSGKSGSTAAHAKDDKLYNSCVEFESLFIKQMLDAMRKTVEKSDFLHGGTSEDIFEDMLYDEYSMLMAKNSGFGLADVVYRQLTPQLSGVIAPENRIE